MNRTSAILGLIVLLSVAACDSQDPEPWVDAVPGIEVRNEANSYLGRLGDPVALGPANGGVRVNAPYPNPGVGQTTFPYSVTQAGPVEVRIDRLPPTPALNQTVRSVIPGFSHGSAQVVRVYPAEPRTEGSYEFRWDGLNEAGQPAGSGYYRVTLQAGADSYTMDVIIVQSEAEMLALRAAARR